MSDLIVPDKFRKCTRTTIGMALCGRPAWYKFELDARHWPGVKTSTGIIKGFACQDHGKDVWAMKGLISSQTIV
jgi:hypothetical protein